MLLRMSGASKGGTMLYSLPLGLSGIAAVAA